jgi:hypothetical protein
MRSRGPDDVHEPGEEKPGLRLEIRDDAVFLDLVNPNDFDLCVYRLGRLWRVRVQFRSAPRERDRSRPGSLCGVLPTGARGRLWSRLFSSLSIEMLAEKLASPAFAALKAIVFFAMHLAEKLAGRLSF